MSPVAYAFAIGAALFTLVLVVSMLRKGRLRERHAIWWIVGSFLALVVSIFPVTLEWASSLIGFQLGTNLVYFVSIALLVLVAIQHSAELTRVEAQVRTLAEALAMQQLRTDLAAAPPAPPTDPEDDPAADA